MIAPLYAPHLGYMPGAPGLGVISDAEYADAENAGVDTATLDQLNALGATDAEIAEVVNGTLDPQVLANELAQAQGSVAPVVATPASPAAPIISPGFQPPSASASPSLQVPPGSQLLYTASWPTLSPSFSTATAGIAAIQNGASAHGLSVTAAVNTSTTASLTSSIQVTVYANTGFGLITDVKSILDGLLYGQIGNMPTSNMALISSPSTPVPPGGVVAAPSVAGAESWISSNAIPITIGIGLIGLLIAMKK